MGSATAEITINRSADEVWSTIGDFANPGWLLGAKSWRLEDGVRTVTMHDMDLEMSERLLHHDEADRTFSYAAVGAAGRTRVDLGDGRIFDAKQLVGNHKATIAVHAQGEQACRVTYEVSLDADEFMIQSTKGQYQSALEQLKSRLENAPAG